MIELIWKEFHQKLLQFILAKVGDAAIAEDILQEVFIQVVKNINSLKDKAKLQAWLYQICRNKIIDYYRIKKLDTVSIDSAETADDKEAPQEAAQLDSCIRILISDLPASVSAIMQASELDEIKQKDIAINEGLSLPAVKSRIRRGRVLLKKKLLACCSIEFTENGTDAICKSQCGCEDGN
ncbi:MAG: RNA polymerase subunit sigma [Methylophilaceae bacterium]|nr:MAG: RNA polymerase subunit sigma [Methylophilaceae bacterium]